MKLVTDSLQENYQTMIVSRTDFQADSAQQHAVDLLQEALNYLHNKRTFLQTATPPHIYLWGPVGRGKTMLMDMFCDCISDKQVLRLHFHHFMAMIHQKLQYYSGHKDPLAKIAQQLSKQYRVLCFDEFQVSDIGDAMLLGRLYSALFQHKILVISTSNIIPDDLYKDGLHRDRFSPTIQKIKKSMQIHSLDGGRDHRRRVHALKPAYFVNQNQKLLEIFQDITNLQPSGSPQEILLCNRTIFCKAVTSGAIWFDFDAICEGPRSALDYIDLANKYHSVFIEEVPQFTGSNREQIKARGTEDSSSGVNPTGARQVLQSATDDSARRFISLVDELYDRRINLYLSAAALPEELYQAELLQMPFKRTLSRLNEMSSETYQNTPPIKAIY